MGFARIVLLTLLLLPLMAQAKMHTEKVVYKDGDTELTGFLFWDDAFEGKRPGVMVVHEWWGLNDYAKLRAEMLAEQGYVAFAADMYGSGKATRHGKDAKAWMKQITANVEQWRKRALLGLKQLKQHDKVDGANMAAIGYCFGGATVMQMAYTDADLKAVVSFHGSLPVPKEGSVKAIRPKVLVAHGGSDPFVPLEKVNAFVKVMEAVGADWEMDVYGGARHAFTNPYADSHGMKALSYNEPADRKSWSRMLAFFRSVFEGDE